MGVKKNLEKQVEGKKAMQNMYYLSLVREINKVRALDGKRALPVKNLKYMKVIEMEAMSYGNDINFNMELIGFFASDYIIRKINNMPLKSGFNELRRWNRKTMRNGYVIHEEISYLNVITFTESKQVDELELRHKALTRTWKENKIY